MLSDQVEGGFRQGIAEAFGGAEAGRRHDPTDFHSCRPEHLLGGQRYLGTDAVPRNQHNRRRHATPPHVNLGGKLCYLYE